MESDDGLWMDADDVEAGTVVEKQLCEETQKDRPYFFVLAKEK